MTDIDTPAQSVAADAAGVAQLVHEGLPATRRGQWAWALFEGARDPNVIFQIYIISPFFATVMLNDPIRGQELWGDTTSYAGYITAILSPFLGAIADKGGRRKPWLALFSILMVLSFAGTWIGVPHASRGVVFFVAAMIVLNNVVFELSNAFHGAMLPTIAPPSRIGGLSGLAFALGNGSGVILMLFFFFAFVAPGTIHWAIVPDHPLFGVDVAAHEPERLAGPISAVWMLLLAIPLFLFTPDRTRGTLSAFQAMRGGIGSVVGTLRSLKHYRNVAHYIGARAIFNDGMTGVLTFAGIYAAGIFGFDALAMTIFGIELGVWAMLGGFFGGWIDDRLGSKRALFISIGGTALFFGLSLTMGPDRIFWIIPYDVHGPKLWDAPIFNTPPQIIYLMLMNLSALCIVAGYANNRTMLARIAPHEKMTEFFGLMSLSGTAATFIAPVTVSWLTWYTHSQRGGMIAIVALLLIGWAWMLFVKEERAVAV